MATSISFTASFVVAGERRLFMVLYQPVTRAPEVGVLIVPPFAEELNKSRKLMADCARRLAAQGHAVIMPDLFGTGDSAGEFGAATWGIWLEDLVGCARWLSESMALQRIDYVAFRAGALLLSQAAATLPCFEQSDVVLVQPVIDGSRYLQQFLRLRIMNERLAGGVESVKSLLRVLEDGNSLEVAGYMLNAQLAAGLIKATAADGKLSLATRLTCIECANTLAGTPTLPVAAFVDALRAKSLDARVQVLCAEAFWATQEIAAPVQVAVAVAEALRRDAAGD